MDLALWTEQAVQTRLEDFFEEVNDSYDNDTIVEGPGSWQDIKYGDGVPCEVPGLGTVKHVAEYGGEGQGDEYWVVFSVTSQDVTRHFKMSGGYASYYGGEFDGRLSEVSPKEKVITVWA